jgi:hypothetical protein
VTIGGTPLEEGDVVLLGIVVAALMLKLYTITSQRGDEYHEVTLLTIRLNQSHQITHHLK